MKQNQIEDFKYRFNQVLERSYHSEELTVPQLASDLGLTPRTLHRHCLDCFGEAPINILRQFRIEKAKLLFKSTQNTKEVALSCGFRTEGAFRKAFRQVVGVAPGRYKDEHCAPTDQKLLKSIEEIIGKKIDPTNDIEVVSVLKNELSIALPQKARLNDSLASASLKSEAVELILKYRLLLDEK